MKNHRHSYNLSFLFRPSIFFSICILISCDSQTLRTRVNSQCIKQKEDVEVCITKHIKNEDISIIQLSKNNIISDTIIIGSPLKNITLFEIPKSPYQAIFGLEIHKVTHLSLDQKNYIETKTHHLYTINGGTLNLEFEYIKEMTNSIDSLNWTQMKNDIQFYTDSVVLNQNIYKKKPNGRIYLEQKNYSKEVWIKNKHGKYKLKEKSN